MRVGLAPSAADPEAVVLTIQALAGAGPGAKGARGGDRAMRDVGDERECETDSSPLESSDESSSSSEER